MKKESCGHSLKVPSCITLQSETARKTHLPQVAITGTMDVSDGEGLWPQLSLQTASWPVKQLSPCRRRNGRRDLQKDSESSFSTFAVQPLPAGTNLLLPEARGGDSVRVLEQAQSERHHSTSLAEGSSSSDTPCPPLAQLKWGGVKKQWRIWSLSSGLGVSKPACQTQTLAVREGRDIVQGRRPLSFLVLWLIEWVNKKNAGLSLLRKNRYPFCLPLPESHGNRFVISLLPCCALVWEGSQQHRSRLWHMHALSHGQWTPFR